MTASTQPDTLPRISIQDLKSLSVAPGRLRIIIKHISGYFLPFIYHTSVAGETTMHGIVVHGADVVATEELADAIEAMRELIGTSHPIETPDLADQRTVH